MVSRGETVPTGDTNSKSKTLTNTRHKTIHPNEFPHTVDCSTALYSLMNILYETDRDIHKEVDDLIIKIENELPREVKLKEKKTHKCVVQGEWNTVTHSIWDDG